MQLGVLKSVIQLLSGLNTKHRVEPGYNGVEFHWVAEISRSEAMEFIGRLEAEIAVMQDKLNPFNAATRIEIPTWILDLAR